MAFVVYAAGGVEFGGRFSGFGHLDVGGFDDVARHQRQTVVAALGGDIGVQRFHCLGVRLWRLAVVVLCGATVRPGDYFVVRHGLFAVGVVWLAGRDIGAFVAQPPSGSMMIFI